jgi:peptidyl-prolyl cis-trans isomerase D
MFGTIRRHQKWLLGVIITVVIVAFVIYFDPSVKRGRGGQGGETKALIINGKTITPRMYAEAAREVELLYFLNFRKWPDQDTERAQQIGFDKENEAYLRLFRVAKAEEAGIHVADQTVGQLAHRLLGDYPLDRFEKEVLQPVGLHADDFERFVRNDAAIQQLSAVVGAAGRLVTPAEAESVYRREHQEIGAEIVHFPISNYLSRVTITNGALTNFFSQQMSRYRVPEKIRVSYVEFSKSNFFAEADREIGTVTNLQARLLEAYYKAGTNNFKDTNGNVLSESAAIEQIKTQQREGLALRFAARKANEFANKLYPTDEKEPVRAENLEKVAAQEKLPVHVSEPFDMEQGPTNLNVAPRFTQIAFSLNATNNPIAFQPVEGENGIYVFALKESIPGRPQPFTEVQEKVTEDYRRYHAFSLARSDATNFAAQATNAIAKGQTFEEVAQRLKLKSESLPPISQATESLTNLAERVNIRQLKSVLFGLEPGKVSGYIPNPPEGGYVVYVRAKLPFDDDRVRKELPKFLAELRYQKQNEIFGQWFRKQVEKANLPLNQPKQRNAPRAG